jgi:putative ABC transport system substrate-binding protein
VRTLTRLAIAITPLFIAVLAAAEMEAGNVSQIGFLSTSTPVDPVVDGFRRGLREHGYIEGRNLFIEWRFAEGGGRDRLPGFATDLVSRKVEVIVTAGNVAALAAKEATGTIPIVFAVVHEPVTTGLVSNLGS